MPTTVSITDFRKDIFDLALAMKQTGQSITVTNGSGFAFKAMPIRNEMAERADYVLKHVLPKAGGMWANIPEKRFNKWKKSLRGPKEKVRDYNW